jgi:MFS family permease
MKKIGELNLFRAFRSTNYSLYFFGRSISQFGTWMQRTAVVWMVFSITHSAFWSGATIFAEQFPSFLFSIPGGIAADRYNRYRIIKITQIASMIQSVLLAVLVYTGHSVVWEVLMLSILLGIINAYDLPARQALVHDVVADPSDLPNALALTTATASLAQLLGPALAGIVYSAFGAPTCFLINAASFGGVFLSILLMKLPPYIPKGKEKKMVAEFGEGFTYLKRTPAIGNMILLLGITSLLVLPFNTVIPVFAKDIFKGDAPTFGYITSFVGIGGVIGTIFLASRKPGTHIKSILFVCTILMGLGLIGFALIRNFPVAMFFAAIAGFGAIAQFTICNIVVQSESAPEMRGRVIGITIMAIFGMLPLGSLLIGAVAERFSAPLTVCIQGIIAIIVALIFARYLTGRGKPATANEAKVLEAEEAVEDRQI